MSSKRDPLLSDKDMIVSLEEMVCHRGYAGGACWDTIERQMNGLEVRNHYERLIDEGKLRVVEEVEVWHPSVPEEAWKKWLTAKDDSFTMLLTKCCGQNPRRFQRGSKESYGHPTGIWLCPGCGNPIKR